MQDPQLFDQRFQWVPCFPGVQPTSPLIFTRSHICKNENRFNRLCRYVPDLYLHWCCSKK